MSVQLVVYPQEFKGSTTTNVWYTALADPFFTSVPATATVTLPGGTVPLAYNALNSATPNTNWQSFAYGSTTPPLYTGAQVRFYGHANDGTWDGYSGIYTVLTSLIPGEDYLIYFTISAPSYPNTNSLWKIGIQGSNNIISFNTLGGGVYQDVPCQYGPTNWCPNAFQFTAQNTAEVLAITYQSPDVSFTPEMYGMRVQRLTKNYLIAKGQEILDLYEETNIPLSLSVDDFQNAGEKVQSYSKSFNIPATKHNNKVFDNIFEITRGTTASKFNPYKQTPCIYKQNGITIFQGFLKLINIQEKNGETSYTVNLFSEAVALADILKTLNFSDLDFNELQHDYNRTNIQSSWYKTTGIELTNPLPATTSLAYSTDVGNLTHTNVLIYPFVDWTGTIKRFADTADIANGATAGQPAISSLEDVYRPWIQVRYIIRKILAQTGVEFSYTSQFFDSTEFKNLFMDFNWGADNSPTNFSQAGQANFQGATQTIPASASTLVAFPNNNTFPLQAGYNPATGRLTASQHGTTYAISSTVTIRLNGNSTFAQMNSIRLVWFSSTGYPTYIMSNQQIIGATNDVLSFTLQSPAGMSGVQQNSYFAVEIQNNSGSTMTVQNPSFIYGTVSGVAVTGGSLLNTLRGEMKQWDFFKGIVNMFNLVILQDETNPKNLIIEPYDTIFNTTHQTLDWTHKVDAEELKMQPMKLKQSTLFQYKEDKDYPFSVYKNATGEYNYGSFEWTVPEYTNVRGEGKVEASPFAATLVKPIFDDTPDLIAPVIYGANEDGTEFKGINNKPRILYRTSSSPTLLTQTTYFTPQQNGVTGTTATGYSLFSHTETVPPSPSSNDLNFGACQLLIGSPSPNNLFSLYYSSYFYELYNPDTKTVKLKALLTEKDVSSFDFTNRILIENREFRVNKINYKPDSLSSIELILIP